MPFYTAFMCLVRASLPTFLHRNLSTGKVACLSSLEEGIASARHTLTVSRLPFRWGRAGVHEHTEKSSTKSP